MFEIEIHKMLTANNNPIGEKVYLPQVSYLATELQIISSRSTISTNFGALKSISLT